MIVSVPALMVSPGLCDGLVATLPTFSLASLQPVLPKGAKIIFKKLKPGPGWCGSGVGVLSHNPKVAGPIPGQGMCLGCGFVPRPGACGPGQDTYNPWSWPQSRWVRRHLIDVSLESMVLSLLLSL